VLLRVWQTASAKPATAQEMVERDQPTGLTGETIAKPATAQEMVGRDQPTGLTDETIAKPAIAQEMVGRRIAFLTARNGRMS